jgi:hypothetical protein
MNTRPQSQQQRQRRKRFEFTVGASPEDQAIQQKLDSLTGAGRAKFIRGALLEAIRHEERSYSSPPDSGELRELRELVEGLQRQVKRLGKSASVSTTSGGEAPILQQPEEPDDRHQAVANKLLGLNFEQAFAQAKR